MDVHKKSVVIETLFLCIFFKNCIDNIKYSNTWQRCQTGVIWVFPSSIFMMRILKKRGCQKIIDQTIVQVINPVVESHFSEYSYGFRPGRRSHQFIISKQTLFTPMEKKSLSGAPPDSRKKIENEHKGKPLAHSVQLWQCQRFSALALFRPSAHVWPIK